MRHIEESERKFPSRTFQRSRTGRILVNILDHFRNIDESFRGLRMARLLSDNCISWAKLIASGVPCSDIETDDGTDADEALRDIALELLVLDASYQDKSYVVADVRKTQRNAYRLWTTAEEEQVLAMLVDGHSIGSIAETLGRKPGGIISRIQQIRERHYERLADGRSGAQ